MTRKDFWSVALLAASAAILLRDELFFHRTFFARDLLYLFHPWKALASEQLAAGILPLWNPYAAMGAPLLANFQSAIFYPISLPFYISHFPWALKLFHFLHFFLAGLGAYLFLRRLRFPRSGS